MNLHPRAFTLSLLACTLITAGCSSEGIPPTEHEAVVEKLRKREMALKELEKELKDVKDEAKLDSPELRASKKRIKDLEKKAEEAESGKSV